MLAPCPDVFRCLPFRIYTVTESIHVFDVDQSNFESDVLQASFDHPVLVDFWAPWCGPCRTLGPVIEKVVNERNGTVRLAKVDVDQQQQLAAMFGVRSVPTVVLLRDGQPVDGFAGALPEGAINEFLDRHLGAAPALPDDMGEEPESAPETPQQAVARLQAAQAAAPDDHGIKLDLASAQMRIGDSSTGAAVLAGLPEDMREDPRAARLRDQLKLHELVATAPPLEALQASLAADDGDHASRELLGLRLLATGDYGAGLDQLLAILEADRSWNEGRARERLVTAFNIIDDAELVGQYRRRMSSLLF